MMKNMRNRLFGWMALAAGVLTAGQSQAAEPLILAKGTQAGLYMRYGDMKSSGNYVDNACITSDGNGGWTTGAKLTWKDENTSADFSCYAPYNSEVKDALALSFSIREDQSTSEAQAASDFLYGSAYLSPQSKAYNLSLHHHFARVMIKLSAGEGFTEEELTEGELGVRIKDVCTKAKINLENGDVEATGTTASIKPLPEGTLTFSAIIIPQQVKKLAVIWNNVEYNALLDHYFDKGKSYTLSATLKKKEGGLDISIGDWEDSGEDFGGTVN